MSTETFSKNCPNCGVMMQYTRKKDRNRSEKLGTVCRACALKRTGNPKEKFTCYTCGITFMEWRSQLSNPDKPFCSKQCWYDSETKSLVGQRFGKLLVLNRIRQNQTTLYNCKCDCGKSTTVSHSNLKEGTQSCGCLVIETRGSERKPLKEVVSKAICTFYKRNARKRNYEWQLSYDKFLELINGNCHYCGSGLSNTFTWRYKHEVASLPFNGIDRIVNTTGYTNDNCVSCCRTCNSAKGELTFKQFKEWVSKLYNHLESIIP